MESWRRGWDSNPAALLNLRKLLNLRSATTATAATIARVGYTLGTLSVLLALLFAAVTPAQERTFRVPFHSVNGMIPLDAKVNGQRSNFRRSRQTKRVRARLGMPCCGKSICDYRRMPGSRNSTSGDEYTTYVVILPPFLFVGK